MNQELKPLRVNISLEDLENFIKLYKKFNKTKSEIIKEGLKRMSSFKNK